MNKHSVVIALLLSACVQGALHAQTAGPVRVLPPIDLQKVQDQEEMTYADYKRIPGVDWTDEKHVPSQLTIKVALIACDFEDQEFVITKPKGSDVLGNPGVDPIKREDVSKYYVDFWNGRSKAHNGHTVQEYWMEQSFGKIGVTFVPYGPYRMPKKLFQYGLTEYGARNSGPEGVPIDGSATADCDRLWLADAGNVRDQFQLVFRVFAGYDESSTWQEFGEMKFQTRDDITAEFGNPDPNKPRWAPTRYVPWTSWWAAQRIWSNAAIIASENSGAILHEVSHAAFRIGDNNNNPYVTPYRRAGSGPWDVMDRGTFNGPGGPHSRWRIPSSEGGSMPAGLMLRQRINFSFVPPSNLVMLSREGLAKSGLAVATVIARNVQPGPDGIAGFTVRLDGTPVPIPAAAQQSIRGGRGRAGTGTAPATTTTPVGEGGLFPILAPGGAGTGTATSTAQTTSSAPARGGTRGRAPISGRGPTVGVTDLATGMTQDRTPWQDPATQPFSQGVPNFTYYSMEVVQRTGYDSFCPDSGVLIAKNKDNESTNGGPNAFNCFNWVIDAHPEDINKLDFKRPNGEPVMRTIADYRQLNDALFHAGTNSGSASEWKDEANRLHFYIIDRKTDDRGVLSYILGVRSLDGSGPQTRGVELTTPGAPALAGTTFSAISFSLKNSGKSAETDAGLHPRIDAAFLGTDIYRLSAKVEGAGWHAQLQNALAAVKFGESQSIPVHVAHDAGAAASAIVTLTATSESDPSKTQTVTYRVVATQ